MMLAKAWAPVDPHDFRVAKSRSLAARGFVAVTCNIRLQSEGEPGCCADARLGSPRSRNAAAFEVALIFFIGRSATALGHRLRKLSYTRARPERRIATEVQYMGCYRRNTASSPCERS